MKDIIIATSPESHSYVRLILNHKLHYNPRQTRIEINDFSFDTDYRITLQSINRDSDKYYFYGLLVCGAFFIGNIESSVVDFIKSRVRPENRCPDLIYDFDKFFESNGISSKSIIDPNYMPVYNPNKDELSMLKMLYPERFK